MLPPLPCYKKRRLTERARGFTLIELLVVLVLAALAVGVVGTSAQTYMQRARYHESVKNLAQLLRQAKALSQKEGRVVVLSYQPQMRQLAMDSQVVLELPQGLGVRWQEIATGSQGLGVRGVPIFVFNPDGMARGGALAVSLNGQAVSFQVNWLLGTIRQTAGNS